MAHHAVPALIHTRAVRSNATRGRQQSTSGDASGGEGATHGAGGINNGANPELGAAKTVSISQQSLWVLFFMTPFAIPMLIYGNLDSDIKRRICLGTTLAVFIMILVCLPLAAFNTRVNYNARHHDNDDRLLAEQRNVTVRRQLLSTAVITTATVAPPARSRNYEYPTSGPPAYSAPSSDYIARNNIHFYPWCNASGPSPSQSSEGLRTTAYPSDDPPPYYRVVFNLPLPEVHNRDRDPPRPVETPPPPYDKVQV